MENVNDELNTYQHYEFIGSHDDVSEFDFRVCAAFGAMSRGINKLEALKKYELTEEQFDKNIQRVLEDPSW